MRLAHYSLHVYRLPYERPVRWSDIVEETAQFLLLKLVSDTGHTGVAEMTIKPTWTGASLRSLAASIEDVFVPLLEKQQDLSDPALVRCQLDGIPENHAAKALIDNAVSTIPIPLAFSDQYYTLRAAIDLVRQRLAAHAVQAHGAMG